LSALAAGRSYATTGPRITSIAVDGEALRVRSTPARSITVVAQPPYGARVNAGHHELAFFGTRLATADGHGGEGLLDGEWLSGADFPAMAGAAGLRYLRVVVTDPQGRSAWSNPIWL
jgi:hypothetical protein